MSVDLDRLIRFCVIAEELSFTRAARRLNVDQPWLSRQIHQLEEQLGYALFERTTRRVALTPEGRSLLGVASDLTQAATRARSMAKALGRACAANVRIGVTSFSYWAPERHAILEQFTRQNSGALISLSTCHTPALLENLRAYELEVAIVRTGSEGVGDFDYLPLHTSAPGLLIPFEHPLATRPEIRLRDLAGETLSVTDPAPNPSACNLIYRPFIEAGMVLQDFSESRSAQLFYARRGNCLAVGFMGRDGQPADEGGFIYRRVADLSAIEQFGVVRNRGDNRPLVRAFWSLAQGLASNENARRSDSLERAAECV